jgi:hypothetical protein
MKSIIGRDCLPKLQLIIITGQNLKHSSSSSSSMSNSNKKQHLDKKQRQQALQSELPADVDDASGQHDDASGQHDYASGQHDDASGQHDDASELDDDDEDDLDEDEDGERAYSLMREVQEVLIEDFYPPISSSTVPNNPGRLLVDLTSLHTWNDDDGGDGERDEVETA